MLGLLGDDNILHVRELLGVKVLAGFAGLPVITDGLGVSHAIVAMPSVENHVRRRAWNCPRKVG